MENCLLNYFIVNKKLKNACDFKPLLLKEGKGVYEIVRVITKRGLPEKHVGFCKQDVSGDSRLRN